MDHLLSREKRRCGYCLVLNVLDIQEDIENWIVVKKIAKTIKKRLDIKEKV